MVRKIFKKRKDNSNKTKPRGRKRKLAASAMLSLRLLFGGPQLASSNSNTFQSGGNSETEISRVSEQNSPSMSDLNQAQPEQVRKGTQGSQITLKIPSGGDSSRPSKFGPGSKVKGAAKRDFSQRQAGKTPTSRQSSGSFFTDAFTVRPQYPGRPGGLEPFGRVPPKLAPNQGNPGGGDRPRSSTTLSSKPSQSEYQPDGYSEEQIQSYRKNPRYSELAQDPQLMGQECSINPKSEEEACTVLQAENEGLVTGAERTDLKAGDPNYDYKTTTPTRFTEIKVPRDSSLKDAARLGRKSGLQQGNDGDVTLLVNLM